MGFRELMILKAMKGGGGSYVQETASGNPLTFNTNIAKPLKSLLIPWTPTQSGTGDPSPSNVRPISGVSGLTVWMTGANLIDDTKRSSAGIGYSLYIGATDSDYHIPLKAGTYRFTAEMLNGASYDLYFREKNGQANYIWMGAANKTTATFTIPYDGLYRFNMTGANPANVGNCWVTYGEDETQYSPYTGTTIPVTFPAEVGTVYSGSLNLTTGVLTFTHKSVTFVGAESEGWSYGSSRFYTNAIADAKTVVSTRTEVLCNIGKFASTGSDNFAIFAYERTDHVKFLYYYNGEITSVADFQTWLASNNMQVVYELAEPQTVQLTPQQITALVGDNVIWSDTNGSNTAVYLKRG